jgi:hypothetical protein
MTLRAMFCKFFAMIYDLAANSQESTVFFRRVKASKQAAWLHPGRQG